VVFAVKKVDEDGEGGGEDVVDVHGGRIGAAQCRMWWKVVVEGEDVEIEKRQDGWVYIPGQRGMFNISEKS
jgi:hypothetical protein